ncbi:olfactory receptor 51E1-like [Megalops cyprinoides]|uniref:olfactory receptor 51E1-like n=1 Tax=Megalops cyprinoides TaxID=118141 RepID=UPI001863A329|nr:olfactory receptor 51E1-like [Megalops cyprinoides]
MEDSSMEIVFKLQGLNETTTNKQIYFAFTLLSYLFTIFVNLTLIVTIFLEKMLHEPMYIFLCNLCINGIFGASTFYPKLFIDFLSDMHVISYIACMGQMFAIYSYVFCEFTTLTVMAYDRYVAICKPLNYHSIITPRRVMKLLLITWLFSLCESAIGMSLVTRLPLCGFDIDKLYCTNWAVVKLSCADTTANNIYGYILIVSHILQALLIMVSYIHIIRASVRSRAEQNKFMQTCLPHLISLTNFTIALAFDVLYARYGSSSRLQSFRNFLAVEYLIVPPLLNPLIYGIKLNQIRTRIMRLCSRKIHAVK